MQQSIVNGLALTHEKYAAAMRCIERCVNRLDGIFEGHDALLTPTANGFAPEGLERTGHHGFQSIWTMMGTPAITLPTHIAANGLPVGIQLVGRHGADNKLLSDAQWVRDRLS